MISRRAPQAQGGPTVGSADLDPRARSAPWTIAIIGAGPGGLCMAIELRKAGIEDFVILEKGSGVGGTWRHNTYPGLSCDVRSHLYSFSFEPKRDWTRPYPDQPEILAYLEQVAAKHEIGSHLRTHTEVRSARWNDERALWELVTVTDERIEAQIVVSAMGMFNELQWPEIPGLREFRGTLFHAARWNHAHDLDGRSVAVIGSAATAVQMIPELAKRVARLYVHQRSANWVLPKQNDPFSPEQIARFVHEPDAARKERQKIFGEVEERCTFSDPQMRRDAEAAGHHALSVVADPEVRRKLTPSVPWGCHRPLVTNDYYPTFNRPNVELVTERIERIGSESIVTSDGKERRVDTIVLATGFQVTRFLSAIEVTGRKGARLDEEWREGARAYLGISVPGFPNVFMLYGPNTNNGSILQMLEYQVEFVLRQIQRIATEHLAWMDVRSEVLARYDAEIQQELAAIEVWQAACHNYYRAESGRIVTQWPNTMSEYRRRCWNSSPDAYEVGLRAHRA
jgi:cation diffusion facilitator CzcD-associated flavoprotein CzcO